MDREEKVSNEQGKAPSDTKTLEASQRKKNPSRTRPRKRQRGITTQVKLLIAFITAITPITVAWLSYKSTHPAPTPTSTSTFTSTAVPTEHFAEASVTSTHTPLPSLVPSLTSTTEPPFVPSETVTSLPQPKLIVLLEVSKTSGRKPLNVKLDARNSYITDYSGQKFVCRNGTCSYTWKVYSNGAQLGKSVTDSGGTFDYTFGKQGTYMVTVWICRGQDKVDCGGSGAQIVVTK